MTTTLYYLGTNINYIVMQGYLLCYDLSTLGKTK